MQHERGGLRMRIERFPDSCAFDGCERPRKARGLCDGHYMQHRQGGQLKELKRHARHGISLGERIDMHTDKSGDCWLWTGATNELGYGQVRVEGKNRKAHRVSYELANGSIPKGLMIDHICHTPSCVRPEHLRLATSKQNQENRIAPRIGNKSGVRGVTWVPANRRWVARVGHNRKCIHVGCFDTIEEAEAAVIAKRLELFTHNNSDFH